MKRMMMKGAVAVLVSVIAFGVVSGAAHANPPSSPGAGDCAEEEDNVPDGIGGSFETCVEGDVANVHAGQNPPLGADDNGGFLHNPSAALGNVVFPAIIAHNPLCDIHDDETH